MSDDSKHITNTIKNPTGKPLTEALRARHQRELRLQKEAERREGKTSILEKLKTHRFLMVRAIYYTLHSIWLAAMAIGGFIAWLISFLFI